MTELLVERRWEEPLTDADMGAMTERAGGCLAIHRVHWNRSLLSTDGRELLCHFSGADAESVRIALPGTARGHIWAGTVHDAPGFTDDELAQANVLASFRFEEPGAFEVLQAQGDAGAVCLRSHRVRSVRTFLSTDRRRMICLYRAPDAESVRIALRDGKLPAERVWAFRQFRP